MNYPRCKSPDHKKNERAAGRQQYKCNNCGYNYSVELKSTAISVSVKRQALQLYLEGLGFRSIGRFLSIRLINRRHMQSFFQKSLILNLRQKRIQLKAITAYSGTFWQG